MGQWVRIDAHFNHLGHANELDFSVLDHKMQWIESRREFIFLLRMFSECISRDLFANDLKLIGVNGLCSLSIFGLYEPNLMFIYLMISPSTRSHRGS